MKTDIDSEPLIEAGTIAFLNTQGKHVTHGITDMVWQLEAPGIIPKHQFTGTLEQVVGHIKKNFPAYEWPSPTPTSHNSSTTVTAKERDRAPDPTETAVVRCYGFGGADPSEIWQGIQYLRQVPGMPDNGPGPGSCQRVSCSWESGIWFCNDNPFEIVLSDYSRIADMAEGVWDSCRHGPVGGPYYVNGQNFDFVQGWNVIVRGTPDSGPERC